MHHITLRSLIVLTALAIMLIQTGCSIFSCNPLQGDIKVYSGNKGGEQEQAPSAPPVIQSPLQPDNPVERQVTVTEANSVFSIGLPPGYKEERRVNAQKPIDFWFEYLTPDMSLEINGIAVEIPIRRSSAKLGYTSNVTSFSYVIKNLTSQTVSYNLRMVPSKAGDAVPAVTREKWIAP